MNQDTAKLLHETDMGLQMAMYSFDQLLERVKDPQMKQVITESRNEHKTLERETKDMMESCGVSEGEPGCMAKVMAWTETNMKMSMEDSDRAIAGVIVDGCNSGSKKLSKYINRYSEADPDVSELAKKLITIEDGLEDNLRNYL